MTAEAQARAADPRLNAFVTAHAGSGKTKTLIDRVARLLLAGVQPERMLCVTYTKAAAAEMQHRLFERLGKWSVMDDKPLAQDLGELTGRRGDSLDLARARSLFAQALETPGGLKIQTLHAFCERLLRRFPLEAGVSPGFTVLDDASAAVVADQARRAVAVSADRSDELLGQAYRRLAVTLGRFDEAFDDFTARREAIAAYLERFEDFEALCVDIRRACGLGPEVRDAAEIEREALSRIDLEPLRRAARLLIDQGTPTQSDWALGLAAALEHPGIEDLCSVVLNPQGKIANNLQAPKVLKAAGLVEPLADIVQALTEALETLCAERVAADTAQILTLAWVYLDAYAAAKRAGGYLDYTDLVTRALALVAERPDAAWVLYKLDGGIDHILVDEAQDTAPAQWQMVGALAESFFTGQGPERDQAPGRPERSIFVVGDEKQSIYSFQGADPTRLLSESLRYGQMVADAGGAFSPISLTTSWRSVEPVLALVDSVFGDPNRALAVPPPPGEALVHHVSPLRAGHPGSVDLWGLIQVEKPEAQTAWDPIAAQTADTVDRRLALAVVQEISDLIARGDQVFDKALRRFRPAGAGDVLILVRRRGILFETLIRELKRAGLPVAGADRLKLADHIVFADVMALFAFALMSEDDLTLAALLKSPIVGLGDDDLFALAHGRGPTPLWQVLGARAAEDARWTEARDRLAAWLDLSARLSPFDALTTLLAQRDGRGLSMRARIKARLGGEGLDALEATLAQVLAAEAAGARDLQTLHGRLGGLATEVKRDMEAAQGQVRVMTAHGAKGLEAPIVFLPETIVGSPNAQGLQATDEGGFLWSGAGSCAALKRAKDARKAREADESLRLLYVAMTRARDRLIVCGRLPSNAKPDTVKDWYGAVCTTFDALEAEGRVRTLDGPNGLTIRRFGADPQPMAGHAASSRAEPDLPAWLEKAPQPEAGRSWTSPSRLEDRARAPSLSPLARRGAEARYRRGALIHSLLQRLPDLAPEARRAAAMAVMARELDLSEAARLEMVEAAMGVLEHPAFAEVFAPGSRAEAAVAGRPSALADGSVVSGRLDRLVVTPDRVLVIDFKTNRPAPPSIDQADPAYLAQMAVYVALLRDLYPGRRVEAALVWTDGPSLMPVPDALIARELQRLARPPAAS